MKAVRQNRQIFGGIRVTMMKPLFGTSLLQLPRGLR